MDFKGHIYRLPCNQTFFPLHFGASKKLLSQLLGMNVDWNWWHPLPNSFPSTVFATIGQRRGFSPKHGRLWNFQDNTNGKFKTCGVKIMLYHSWIRMLFPVLKRNTLYLSSFPLTGEPLAILNFHFSILRQSSINYSCKVCWFIRRCLDIECQSWDHWKIDINWPHMDSPV